MRMVRDIKEYMREFADNAELTSEQHYINSLLEPMADHSFGARVPTH